MKAKSDFLNDLIALTLLGGGFAWSEILMVKIYRAPPGHEFHLGPLPVLVISLVSSIALTLILFSISGHWKREPMTRMKDLGRIVVPMLICLLLQSIITIFAVGYTYSGLVNAKGETIYDVWSALYFSVITFTTVGYGDLAPTVDSRILACAEAFTGYAALAVVISTIISKMSERRHKDEK